MKAIVLLVIALLALAPVVTSITCYYGTVTTGVGGSYSQSSPCDICTSISATVGSITSTSKGCYGSGTGTVTCSAYTSSGYSCCTTNLCNGAKMNGMSILMASVAVIVGLFRSL